MRTFGAFLATLLVALSSSAQITDFRAVLIDNTGGGSALNGFATHSLQIDFEFEFSGAQLLLHLDSGRIYRDEPGNPNGSAPDPALFPSTPSLEFDSYFGNGVLFNSVGVSGGAVDLGGDPFASWPATTTAAPVSLNQAWGPSGSGILGGLDYETFRLTLSQDAGGSFTFLAVANGEIFRSGGVIRGGVVIVPEPTTVLVAGAAGLAVAARRRPVRRSA